MVALIIFSLIEIALLLYVHVIHTEDDTIARGICRFVSILMILPLTISAGGVLADFLTKPLAEYEFMANFTRTVILVLSTFLGFILMISRMKAIYDK